MPTRVRSPRARGVSFSSTRVLYACVHVPGCDRQPSTTRPAEAECRPNRNRSSAPLCHPARSAMGRACASSLVAACVGALLFEVGGQRTVSLSVGVVVTGARDAAVANGEPGEMVTQLYAPRACEYGVGGRSGGRDVRRRHAAVARHIGSAGSQTRRNSLRCPTRGVFAQVRPPLRMLSTSRPGVAAALHFKTALASRLACS